MRHLLLVPLLAACGATAPRSTEAPDDLDLEPVMVRRTLVASSARAPDPGIRVEIVAPSTMAIVGPQIDLGVQDAEITDVLRTIAAVADFGLVVSDDVRARMTLEMRDVTWREAIRVIADLEGLQVSEADGILLVTR